MLTDAVKDAERFVVGHKECQKVISDIVLASFNNLRGNQEFKDKFEELDKLLDINTTRNTELIKPSTSAAEFVG